MPIINEILKSVVMLIITSLFSYFLGIMKSESAKSKAHKNADLVLLRDKLYHYYDKYGNGEEMPLVLYDNMLEMRDCYVALGGNGTVKKMCEELQNKRLK